MLACITLQFRHLNRIIYYNWIVTTSGVPQGSILGPLLFNIMVNDITECFHKANILLYADDLKVFMRVESWDDAVAMQQDLDRFSNYCTYNRLHLNVNKCFVMSFTRNRNIIDYPYKLNDCKLSSKTVAKDLGIFLDSKLLFDQHINYIVGKAMKTLGFIIRHSKKFSNAHAIKTLYFTYVRCQIEYGSQIWNPQYNQYVLALDRVQNKFLRFLNFTCRINLKNYDDACKYHKILPLTARRELMDQIFLYKIINNHLDCPILTSSILYSVPHRFNLRHKPIFQCEPSKSNYVRNSYLRRATRIHNNKYVDCDIFYLSLHQFKKQIILKLLM